METKVSPHGKAYYVMESMDRDYWDGINDYHFIDSYLWMVFGFTDKDGHYTFHIKSMKKNYGN